VGERKGEAEMTIYRVHYKAGAPQEVEAETFDDGGHEANWIDFKSDGRTVLRIRAEDVKSIEIPKKP
jgi:hypothetical protein